MGPWGKNAPGDRSDSKSSCREMCWSAQMSRVSRNMSRCQKVLGQSDTWPSHTEWHPCHSPCSEYSTEVVSHDVWEHALVDPN